MAYTNTNVDYVTNQEGINECLHFIKHVMNERLLALDTETNSLNARKGQVLLVQVGNGQRQFVLDVYELGQGIYQVLEEIAGDDYTKVIHNAKFDYKFIKTNFDIELENVADTMLGEQLLTQGKPSVKASLEDVAKKYLGVELSKDPQSSFASMKLGDEFSQKQIDYAGQDVEYLIPIYKDIQSLLSDRNMSTLSDIEYETARVTGDMELCGIKINRQKWLELKDEALKKQRQAREELDEIFRDAADKNMFGHPEINYNSPAQLEPLLESVTGKELPGTGKDVLKKLNHPAAEKLLDYRKAQKRVGTYGREFIEKHQESDGRIYSRFLQLHADSGRFSSRDPNLQNIPSEAEYREPFEAQNEEYKFIAADFASQELKLLAAVSEEKTMINAIKEGKDLHSYSASLIFDVPYEDFFDEDGNRIPEMEEKYRDPCKDITFGLLYGAGPSKLSDQLGISYRDAKRLIEKYFRTFPKVKQTMDALEEHVVKNKYAISPLDGRRIDLGSMDWDNGGHVAHAKNIAKNLPYQGGGASVTKMAMCRIKRKIDENEYDADLIGTVHDEVLLESHVGDLDEVTEMVEREMINGFNFFCPDVPMEVDLHVDDYWVH